MIWTLFVGLFIGGTVGFLACAMLSSGSDSDDHMEAWHLGFEAGHAVGVSVGLNQAALERAERDWQAHHDRISGVDL